MNKLPGLFAVPCCTGLPGKTGNTLIRVFLPLILLLCLLPRAESVERVPVTGKVMFGDTPLCTLVLANGQNTFTCNGDGSFNLSVPLDSNGQVTLFTFAQGFAPYRQTLAPAQVANTTINMVREPEGRTLSVDYSTSDATRAGWKVINGTVDINGTPVCTLMLANGQHMFSCNKNLGRFSLEVPSDNNGNITLFSFVSGLQPYKEVFPAKQQFGDIDISDPLLARCIESEAATNGWNSADEVTGLDCPQAGIKQLNGLQSFVNIEVLNLRGNQIDDISLLNALKGLRELDLSSLPGLTDIDALLSLDALAVLNLNGSGDGNLNCADLDALSLALETFSRPAGCNVTNNLTASTLQITSLDPRIGYPLDVTVSIAATEATENASVTFFAINKDPADDRQLPLGTGMIDLVETGNRSYDLTLDIPSSVEIPGLYLIGAIVDPVNAIAETDEDDNLAFTEATLSAEETLNVFIEKIELDSRVLSLDTTEYEESDGGVQNADAGGTLTLGMQGADVPIDVEAFAYLRLTRSDGGGATPGGPILFSHTDPDPDSHHVPLYLWNTEQKRYMNAYGVDPVQGNTGVEEWLPLGQIEPQLIDDGIDKVTFNGLDRRLVHLDIYFPGRLAWELEVAVRHLNVFLSDPLQPPPDLSTTEIQALGRFLRNLPASSDPDKPFDEGPALAVLSVAICVEVRPSDSSVGQDRFADDNTFCSPVALDLPPLPPPRPVPVTPPPEFTPIYTNPSHSVLLNEGYRDDWGGKYFGVGVNFSASSSVDINGFIAQASGIVPVRFFGIGLNFLEARGRLQLLPNFAGPPVGQASGFTLVLRFAGQDIFNDFSPIGEVSFSGELTPPPAFSKEKRVKKRFYPGGVPVTVEGFVGGRIGAKYTLDFQRRAFPLSTSLDLASDTFAVLDAGAEALVGIGGFIGFGAEGSLTLLKESYQVGTGAELAVLHDGFAPGGIVEIEFKPKLTIVNEVTGAVGKVLVYAEFPVPYVKFCGSRIFKIPCGGGFRTSREELVIDRFMAYRKVDTLLNEMTVIDVVRLIDGSVGYFSPNP